MKRSIGHSPSSYSNDLQHSQAACTLTLRLFLN
jgi:hypothetical protein